MKCIKELAGTLLHTSEYPMRVGKYCNGRVKYINQDLMLIKSVNFVDKTKEFGSITLNARTQIQKWNNFNKKLKNM